MLLDYSDNPDSLRGMAYELSQRTHQMVIPVSYRPGVMFRLWDVDPDEIGEAREVEIETPDKDDQMSNVVTIDVDTDGIVSGLITCVSWLATFNLAAFKLLGIVSIGWLAVFVPVAAVFALKFVALAALLIGGGLAGAAERKFQQAKQS